MWPTPRPPATFWARPTASGPARGRISLAPALPGGHDDVNMKRTKAAAARPRTGKSPTLRELASKLGLSPATVSLVLNGETSIGIAAETQELVRAKAREMGYRPNFLARSLRTRRSYSVGVMIPGVSQGYNVLVLQGIEEHLASRGYFHYVASHYMKQELVQEYAHGFTDRGADGLILVSAPWTMQLSIPVATISSHHAVRGTTSVIL